jgi:DNA-binding MurR/RpiR family transcriptional regulator
MPQHGRRKADKVLLAALGCGATIEVAAHKAGVSVATVYRRLQDSEFKKGLQKFQSDMVQRSASTLTAATTEAIKTLLSLQQTSNPPAVRLGSARSIIELGTKLRETADLEQRIAALEQKQEAGGVT